MPPSLPLMLSSWLAWAPAVPVEDAPAAVRLEWEAPAACPDADAVRLRTERLLGRPLTDPRHPQVEASASVRGHGAAWSADLRLATASGHQRRSLRARSCEALAEATALLFALTIDPTAQLDAAAPEPQPPEPEPQPEPEPEPPPATPPAPAPVRAPAPVTAPAPRSGGWPRGFVAAELHANAGALPAAGLGVRVAGGLRWRRARVLAAASYSASGARAIAAAPELRIAGDQWWVGLAGCAIVPRGRVELPFCAGWYAGAVRARVGGLASGGRLALPWTGALVDTGLRVVVHPRVGVGVYVGTQIPVLRPTFAITGLGVVHTTWPLTLVGQLGLEILLP